MCAEIPSYYPGLSLLTLFSLRDPSRSFQHCIIASQRFSYSPAFRTGLAVGFARNILQARKPHALSGSHVLPGNVDRSAENQRAAHDCNKADLLLQNNDAQEHADQRL